jgi:hypothetical protein
MRATSPTFVAIMVALTIITLWIWLMWWALKL